LTIRTLSPSLFSHFNLAIASAWCGIPDRSIVWGAFRYTSGLVLIHALNAFGFAWLRRVNEENVDLNRNFHDFTNPLPSSEAYEALHDWLIPEEWEGKTREQSDAALRDYATRDFRKFQAELTAGQYRPM
jgi:hypothetical protein